jgi:hypothetical protein
MSIRVESERERVELTGDAERARTDERLGYPLTFAGCQIDSEVE